MALSLGEEAYAPLQDTGRIKLIGFEPDDPEDFWNPKLLSKPNKSAEDAAELVPTESPHVDGPLIHEVELARDRIAQVSGVRREFVKIFIDFNPYLPAETEPSWSTR